MLGKAQKMFKIIYNDVEKALLDLPVYMKENSTISNSNDSFLLSSYLLNKFIIEFE